MESNEILEQMLQTLGIPVAEERYHGKEERYIVYVEALQQGINYADNMPQEDRTAYQVQYFCPLINDDSRKMTRQIKKALNYANVYIGDVTRRRNDEAEMRQVIIECEMITPNKEKED